MVKMAQVLEYRLIFPDIQSRDLKQYIAGISKSILLKAACFFSMTTITKQTNKELLSNWFQAGNQEFLTSIWEKVHTLERETYIVIINPFTSLLLFELVLHEWEETASKKDDLESEKDLFMLYLLLNERYTQKDHLVSESTKFLDTKCRHEGMYFSNSFVDCDITNYEIKKVIITQFQKAYLLLQELESNGQFSDLLLKFCSYYNVIDWKEYLRKVLPLVFSIVKSKNAGNIEINVTKGANFESDCEFLEKFSISEKETYDVDVDFLEIRSRPLLVVEKGRYVIINELFLCERLFKGLYFKLNEINAQLEKPIVEFKSLYCDIFSEKRLVYNVLNETFKYRYQKFSGEELHNLGISREPDYYIRNRNKILLFESKDILIPAPVKTSGDFNQLKKVLRNKLYFEIDHKKHKIKPKAILQIINNIERLLKGEIFVDVDTELKGKTLNIYPILILHDNLYNALGLNRLLNYWFDKELVKLKKKGMNVWRVRPLVILDIDTMIYLQVAVRKTNYSYEKFIDDFIREVVNINIKNARSHNQAKLMIEQSMISLSFYMEELDIIKKNWSLTPQFEEYGKNLFM
jgi:hypothetical protein